MAWEFIKGPRVPERLPNTITPEQFARIDSNLDEMEYYQLTRKVIFHLLWNTGMGLHADSIRTTRAAPMGLASPLCGVCYKRDDPTGLLMPRLQVMA